LVAAGCLAATGESVFANEVATRSFLMGLRKPDGGFGWSDQPRSHLVVTHAVVSCCDTMQIKLTGTADLANFVRQDHPGKRKPAKQRYHDFDLLQIRTLKLLGAETSEWNEKVARWKAPIPYASQYEKDANPIFRRQIATLLCRRELGLPIDDLKEPMARFLAERRRVNASFNNTPAKDKSDGHVVATWWGIQASRLLGELDESREALIHWLQSCQRPDGGFSWKPTSSQDGPSFSRPTNATYTHAAVSALHLLDAKPLDTTAAITYVLNLRNADHGFAERPGWLSNPLSTYYSIESLARLGALDQAQQPVTRTAVNRPKETRRPAKVTGNLSVYSAQVQAHGVGSPRDAVILAQRLGIHLWGAKNSTPGWIAEAQRVAREVGVAVNFCVTNEDYGTWIKVPGYGTYSHMSDIIAENLTAAAGSLGKGTTVTWPEYRSRRMIPLHKSGGRLIWQFGENEDLVRLLLDDSLTRGGFSAISTFHFGNPDFADTEPFLHLYRGQIPYIALQDAHGKQPWWFSDMTTGFRTLFLAEEPSWEGWLKALENNWTMAVRRDARTNDQLITHSGSSEVTDFAMQRVEQWKWWGNGNNSRPMVSMVALTPKDRCETGCPKRGVAIRVRCAWTNTGRGTLVEPLSALDSLKVDGEVVVPREVRSKLKDGKLDDVYYLYVIPEITQGQHHAEVCVNVLSTGERALQRITF
jgi:prenyltransferase beta subunit